MTRILSIVGARPQFIKAAAISRAAAKKNCRHEILHTGQHYDTQMSAIFFDEMEIPRPSYHLECGGVSHGAMTGRMLEGIEEKLVACRPDWVLIYGDTNSTLAGAIAAAKMHIPVAHLEAGMRCFNRRQPEELNRVLADHASDRLLTATEGASQNLLREGFDPEAIARVGDVMLDSALYYRERLRGTPLDGPFYLATVHRAENTDDPRRLRQVFGGLMELAKKERVAIPLHPRTRNKLVEAELLGEVERKLSVLEPVGYLEMLALESAARLILTDSGGVQKEAYFFQVPCVVLREVTEWVDLVELGGHVLEGGNGEAIVEAAGRVMNRSPLENSSLFGDGHAADKTVDFLCRASF